MDDPPVAHEDPREARGTEHYPQEVSLPSPAIWVEAFARQDQCGAIWFDDTRRATWSPSMPAHYEDEPEDPLVGASFTWYRDEAYRRLPTGLAVSCTVGAQANLTCRYDACTDTVQTQPPLRCRYGGRARPLPPMSSVQRTHPFVPDLPWWRAGLLGGGTSHVCLRREGNVLCYALERDVARPTPIEAPELDALTDVRDLSGAGSMACAVLGDGSVLCWGAPMVAQPAGTDPDDIGATDGDPAFGSPWTPRRIEGLPPVVQVSVGLRSACARTDDGRVFCWGDPHCLIDAIPSDDATPSPTP